MTWTKIIARIIIITHAKFKNWWWKPKIVRICDNDEIDTIYSAIEDGRISSEANRFILEWSFVLSNKYGWKNRDRNNFKELLKLLDISEGSSIKTTCFHFSFDSEQNKANKLVSKSKIHSFIFKKKMYRIESTDSQTKLRGSIFDLNDSHDNMMINWYEFKSFKATITCGDSNDPRLDLCESLSNTDANDNKNIYVLFKKTDIIKFICYNLKDLQEAWNNYPNASIDFTYPIENFSLEENIDALESTPKYFTIDINWNGLKCYKNEQLWKSLIKFRFVRLNNGIFRSILIDREGQSLIFKANCRYFDKKISLANKEISEVINEIILLLTLIDKQYSQKNHPKINWINGIGR